MSVPFGFKHSKETREKISKSLSGRPSANKGRKMSKEFCELQSKLQTGRPSPNKGKVLSEETKSKISAGMKGKKNSLGNKWSLEQRENLAKIRIKGSEHHFWKGGITPINKAIRTSSKYKIWRESVFSRDDWTCIWCGKRGVEIHADHIKPFAHFPGLRFEITNGRTLCVPCHKTTDTYTHKSRKHG